MNYLFNKIQPLSLLGYKLKAVTENVMGLFTEEQATEEENVCKTLYDMHSSKMLGRCILYAKDRAEAEEIVKETFEYIFDNIDYKEASSEELIKKITITTILSYYRRANKLSFLQYDNTNGSAGFSEAMLRDVAPEVLIKIVQSLPRGCCFVFNLYSIEGFSHKEISELLTISEETSESQLLRARTLIKWALMKSYALSKTN